LPVNRCGVPTVSEPYEFFNRMSAASGGPEPLRAKAGYMTGYAVPCILRVSYVVAFWRAHDDGAVPPRTRHPPNR
jgi:hypothetical protein